MFAISSSGSSFISDSDCVFANDCDTLKVLFMVYGDVPVCHLLVVHLLRVYCWGLEGHTFIKCMNLLSLLEVCTPLWVNILEVNDNMLVYWKWGFTVLWVLSWHPLFVHQREEWRYLPPPCVRVHCWHGWVGRAVDLRVRASAKVAFEKDHQSGNQWILQLCQTVEINHPCWCGGGGLTKLPLCPCD
jgi:hypothetical protein